MNLEYPAWLLVWIAVPILAVLAFLLSRFQKRPWEGFTAERLRGKLIKKEHPLPRWISLSLLLAGIIALALSMARPQGDAGTKTQTTEGRNVMIALDLSRSMRVQDVQPDRLSQAKVIIYELLETLEDDRIGLVGFAGTSYLFAPLTIDHAAVQETVEQVDEEWLPRGGSNIASAIQLATETLKETGQKNNALILISDGEEHEGGLDKIVADAEDAGVTIFSIGIGTEDGGFVPHPNYPDGLRDRQGNRVISRLQPDVLRRLATETGGTYVIADRGADIPAMVEAAIQGMSVFKVEGVETKVVVEFYQWALLPGILFLMAAIVAGTRWRGLAGIASAVLFFCLIPDAAADRVQDARAAFSEKRYAEARDLFRTLADEKGDAAEASAFRLGEGLAAYEAQDYRGARAGYSEAMLSKDREIVGKAHAGMANTLFQLGWMGLSGESYPSGEDTPEMEKFDELVREQLSKMAESDVPDVGDTREFKDIDSAILNWTDAVRHYQSAIEKNPKEQSAVKNRDTTMKYLIRLQELLEEEKDRVEQEMPQPGEGQNQEPQPDGSGESENGDQGEEKGEDGNGEAEEEEDEGNGDQEPGEEEGSGDESEDQDGKGGDGDEKDDGGADSEDGEGDPNESPEDRARRKLSENQDLEKGTLAPGRRELINPEKDY